jgi:hypothetical protein
MAQMDYLLTEEENTKKHLQSLAELNKQDLMLTEEIQKKKLAMMEAYNKRAKALQQAQAGVILQSSQSIFDNMANMAGMLAGKQSGVYKGMFAASKAFAIADATVKIAQGIAAASALPFPANIPAMASVAAATMSIVSSIQAVQLAFDGEKARGGPVSAGKTYLVGEKGPELFSPASSGNIIPNNRLGGSGVKVEINNYTDATAQVTERNDNGERVIEVMIKRVKNELATELRDGRGNVTRAMESTFNLKRGR